MTQTVNTLFAAILVLFVSLPCFSAEDKVRDKDKDSDRESDLRPNIVVQTKRPSLGSRSLPRLVELAEQHSPNIKKVKADLEIAQLERRNATAAWLPSLNLDMTHGLRDTTPSTKSTPVACNPRRRGRTARWTPAADRSTASDHQRQGRVFRPANHDLAMKRRAAGDAEFIHPLRLHFV
ncbi:MAG: TolC family protein [Calothrix sp. SM1_5_4]|nr:TolC family protein [Calothrix sp. SM1_5_4]